MNVPFRYAKGHDPDNWLSIDEETAEIKLTKVPDRESKFLVNGTYIAKIICMTQGKNIFHKTLQVTHCFMMITYLR